MKRISFALTKQQILARTKTQTRRIGWWKLTVGEVLRPVEKCMGLKPGEKQKIIGDYDIRVVGIRREYLNEISRKECRLEGFPEKTPDEFISGFCVEMKCDPDQIVNVIDFEYVLREEGM